MKNTIREKKRSNSKNNILKKLESKEFGLVYQIMMRLVLCNSIIKL